MVAIGLDVMFKFPAALLVHIAGIPFASKLGNRISAPMNENTEFGVLIPFRHLIGRQGLPVIVIGSGLDDFFDFL